LDEAKTWQPASIFICFRTLADDLVISVHVYRKYIRAFTTFSGLQNMPDTSWISIMVNKV